ncbi:hypothetical protein Q3V94_13615 [Caloramator sp. CAR-1]|uniref:hypothetical protein n=1 Tax=Caloramator sp. CAR-1 TaxID=3062777 RepID=UPI0026E12822|nr:hypothetical protein [Caloramator sp. CAR-1]MDO6355131.1 hypothetical protein [Caloramator sp. CAR-1]MDO6356088.1 hypothetical protein [Caloramator sp. CAR-1]
MALDMIDIGQAIYETAKRIEKGVNELYKYAKAYAEAEREYRLALAKEIVKLKDEKMQATLIPDVARGNVAELKYKRDLAEVSYKTARDMLEALQAELSGLQSLYKNQGEM